MNAASTTDARKRRDDETAQLADPVDRTFSGQTLYYWGVLRPDGKAVMETPRRSTVWHADEALNIAGFPAPHDDPTYWYADEARRGARDLSQALVDQGVHEAAARHRAVLFTVTTSVTAR